MKKMSLEKISRVAYDVFGTVPVTKDSDSITFIVSVATSFRLSKCNFPFYFLRPRDEETMYLTVLSESIL